MSLYRSWGAFLCVLAFLLGGTGFGADQKKLVLTGSSTVAPLMAEVAKKFEKENLGFRIDVQSGGSGRGIADARQGVADIGMVSRALKDDEKDLTAHTIALDGICVILNKTNTVATLTDAQVIDIYTGKITNWKAVGGKDAPITVVNKAEGRSTLELFLNYFKLKPTEVKAQVIIGDNQQGIKTVAGNPNSIGYVSIGSAEFEAKEGAPIKLMPVGGVEATTANIINGKFPISRPLNLVTKGAPGPVAKLLVDYAKSKKIDDLIKEQYFVIPPVR